MADDRPDPRLLAQMHEPFAAGFFEEPESAPVRRWSRAVRRRFEGRPALPYDGGLLYPAGTLGALPPGAAAQNRILAPSYSFTWSYHEDALETALVSETDPERRRTLAALREAMRAEGARVDVAQSAHSVGGWGYTHSIPNYGRVLREGLDAYEARIRAGLEREGDSAAAADLFLGLLDVLAGIRAWHARLLAALQEWPAPDAGAGQRRGCLVAALEQVPFRPARNFFEAVVAYNLVYTLDDCDNPGRMDQELFPFYEADVAAGRLTRAEAGALLAAFADTVCANRGWSAAIGGTTPEGGPAYNEVTVLLLQASHGRFRPSLELRVGDDMPDAVWEAALDALATGAGNPALYNEPAYLQSLRDADLGIREADLSRWNGGGCTETMIHGCSNVGSLDAGLNLPLVLQASLRSHLPAAPSFEAFLEAFEADVARTVAEVVEGVNRSQAAKAAWRPQPMRSLLVDDCIERGVEFNAGGARYHWSVVNVAGLPNVADSLAALREVVFERREKTGEELLALLDADFAGAEGFRRRLERCSRFGNDLPEVDELAARVAGFVFQEFRRHRPWRGGRFLPSCIQFETYGWAGAPVGATPDGRRAGEPLADCIGPVAGRDHRGPTAMLRSVSRLPLHLATGTPVLNLRLAKALFRTPAGRAQVRSLVESYFRMGGMQIQLSVVSRAELEDALVHPERHGNLIVRIGGYSAYFNALSPELKRSVLARTEYGASG